MSIREQELVLRAAADLALGGVATVVIPCKGAIKVAVWASATDANQLQAQTVTVRGPGTASGNGITFPADMRMLGAGLATAAMNGVAKPFFIVDCVDTTLGWTGPIPYDAIVLSVQGHAANVIPGFEIRCRVYTDNP